MTKNEYTAWLNELDIPEDDKASNGGRIPDCVIAYGTWLRRNDPVAFNVGYNEYCLSQENRAFRASLKTP